MKKCTVLIVTYNSQPFLDQCIHCLKTQTTPPHRIVLIDTGSDNRSYLNAYAKDPRITILFAEKNAGFCRGNNLGYKAITDDSSYVFLLNPDAFVFPDFLEKAIAFLEDPKHAHYGAITGMTRSYTIQTRSPTELIDTTGIFRTWYGRWYDRGQGKSVVDHPYNQAQDLTAICGAVFFCRKTALDSILYKNDLLFDPRFYMYKEDIDLSLRLKQKGWSLRYLPELEAYHCRGWNSDRKKMSRRFRLCSAKNELLVQCKTRNPIAIGYSLLKLGAVYLLNL